MYMYYLGHEMPESISFLRDARRPKSTQRGADMNTKRIIGAAMAFILCVCTCGMNTIGAAAAENRQDTGESTQETAQDAARPDFTLR